MNNIAYKRKKSFAKISFMSELNREYLISYYEKRLELFGKTPAALGWTLKGQRQRYEAILSIGPLEGATVLDYGCGMGDFYGFLREKNIKAEYAGIDINPYLIEVARDRYPECGFKIMDIVEEDLAEDYDYIISCGVFNQKLEGVADSAKYATGRLWGHAKKAFVFNALSDKSRDRDPALQFYGPDDMLEFGKTLSPHAVLREDLVQGDIFLFLYR